jgi:hypothetical protein
MLQRSQVQSVRPIHSKGTERLLFVSELPEVFNVLALVQAKNFHGELEQ